MSTFLRKTARIFASDLDLGFMTWRNVLKDFRTELSRNACTWKLKNIFCYKQPEKTSCGRSADIGLKQSCRVSYWQKQLLLEIHSENKNHQPTIRDLSWELSFFLFRKNVLLIIMRLKWSKMNLKKVIRKTRAQSVYVGLLVLFC